ncbi:MAG: hypothetical protein J7494_12325 [Sphingobium sp.]|nr:hypothetical protein [Sphingobium sp.]
MSFASLDPGIERWAGAHGLRLMREEAVRFCYTSSERECFQIVVWAPVGNRLLIENFSIETIGDEELHEAWEVSVDNLFDGLEQALKMIEVWKKR